MSEDDGDDALAGWPDGTSQEQMDEAMATIDGERHEERERMVSLQLAERGVRDAAVLEAMREIPREIFVPEHLAEFAYHDVALPVEAGQTISQPFVVAVMIQALALPPGSRVLEVGSGSGYAAAVLSRIAGEVYAIERHEELVRSARERLQRLGVENVRIRHGDGTLGWPEYGPYDAILVSAGAPAVPASLREQLKVGARLVIPVGEEPRYQRLMRVTRRSETDFEEEILDEVAFVPLVGEQGWADAGSAVDTADRVDDAGPTTPLPLPSLVAQAAEPFQGIDGADLAPLLERIGDARLVLIGEASHGTSEFYRMRQRITAELIERKGFSFVAVEADWPDAARIDRYVRDLEHPMRQADIFGRFPTWMWRNHEVLEFVEWLRAENARRAGQDGDGQRLLAFYGLDLYSLSSSISEVLHYLDEVDPETARIARQRYGCLSPFESDPATYGLAEITDRYRSCEGDVTAMLVELQKRRSEYAEEDGERFLDAAQNGRLAANAERYYRAMFYGGPDSWNLRDTHMFETLQSLLDFHGRDSRAVVWAHNSHLGNAAATEMAARGEINLGQLVRQAYGFDAYLIGFGTDRGSVAAASEWGGQVEVKRVRPSHRDSYERVCHETQVPSFLLSLRRPRVARLRDELSHPRLERAIGVIYRPDTELQSHYFQARLPRQFDEYIWFDETTAVRPLGGRGRAPELPQTHPFATLDA